MFVNILLERKGMIIGEYHKDNFMVNEDKEVDDAHSKL
jgi:hypothetical protein